MVGVGGAGGRGASPGMEGSCVLPAPGALFYGSLGGSQRAQQGACACAARQVCPCPPPGTAPAHAAQVQAGRAAAVAGALRAPLHPHLCPTTQAACLLAMHLPAMHLPATSLTAARPPAAHLPAPRAAATAARWAGSRGARRCRNSRRQPSPRRRGGWPCARRGLACTWCR